MKWVVNGVEWEAIETDGVEVFENGDRMTVRDGDGSHSALVVKQGEATFISFGGQVFEVLKKTRGRAGGGGGVGDGETRAPMPGQIVDLVIAEGDVVTAGQKVVVLEAMKMQQGLVAGMDGVVKEVKVAVGDQVTDGQVLVVVVPEEES